MLDRLPAEMTLLMARPQLGGWGTGCEVEGGSGDDGGGEGWNESGKGSVVAWLRQRLGVEGLVETPEADDARVRPSSVTPKQNQPSSNRALPRGLGRRMEELMEGGGCYVSLPVPKAHNISTNIHDLQEAVDMSCGTGVGGLGAQGAPAESAGGAGWRKRKRVVVEVVSDIAWSPDEGGEIVVGREGGAGGVGGVGGGHESQGSAGHKVGREGAGKGVGAGVGGGVAVVRGVVNETRGKLVPRIAAGIRCDDNVGQGLGNEDGWHVGMVVGAQALQEQAAAGMPLPTTLATFVGQPA